MQRFDWRAKVLRCLGNALLLACWLVNAQYQEVASDEATPEDMPTEEGLTG
jgi:hypothetical protein